MTFVLSVNKGKLCVTNVTVTDVTTNKKQQKIELDLLTDEICGKYATITGIHNLPGRGKFLIESSMGRGKYDWYVFTIKDSKCNYSLSYYKLERNETSVKLYYIIVSSQFHAGHFIFYTKNEEKFVLVKWQNNNFGEMEDVGLENVFYTPKIFPFWKNYSVGELISECAIMDPSGPLYYYSIGERKIDVGSHTLTYFDRNELLCNDGNILTLGEGKDIHKIKDSGEFSAGEIERRVYVVKKNEDDSYSVVKSCNLVEDKWLKKFVKLPPHVRPWLDNMRFCDGNIILLGFTKDRTTSASVNIFIDFDQESFLVVDSSGGHIEEAIPGLINNSHYKYQFYNHLHSVLDTFPTEIVKIIFSYCFL